MKYLALSILAIRAVGCLFRGKILCQRFASSWFEFSCNTCSKNFYLILYNLATKAIGCRVR